MNRSILLYVIKTQDICKKFQITSDKTHYFYPSNVRSIENPFDNVSIFSQFISDIPFVTRNEEELNALFFQFRRREGKSTPPPPTHFSDKSDGFSLKSLQSLTPPSSLSKSFRRPCPSCQGKIDRNNCL